MNKARSFASKEVTTLKQFNVNVLKPTEIYVLGLFDTKKSNTFEIYSDFAAQYGDDVQFFHSFKTAELLESLGNPSNVQVPAILVVYHDLAIVKKEPRFRVFSQVRTN